MHYYEIWANFWFFPYEMDSDGEKRGRPSCRYLKIWKSTYESYSRFKGTKEFDKAKYTWHQLNEQSSV